MSFRPSFIPSVILRCHRLSVCLSVSLMLTSCAYSVHDIFVSGFDPYTPQSSGKVIYAHAEQFSFMGFNRQTNYLNSAYEELQNQCTGEIVGIVTEFQTALGFFSWTNHIYMKGLCINGRSKASEQAALDSDEFLM